MSAAPSTRRTHAERMRSRDGYFGPESIVRRLGNTPVTPLLGGGAAVLLQVAHPLVAWGVVEHSGYRHDLWKRLVGTLRALYQVTYGDKAEAERAGARVRQAHRRVYGTTTCQLGVFPPGTRYSACDPQLMLWVHATLVYSSLAAYQRFVEPLSERELEQYHAEMRTVAQLFGAPASVLPRSYAEFCDYVDAQFESDTIRATLPAQKIASVILATPLPAPLRLLAPAHRLATARILPPRLRREYNLRWTPLHELALPVAGHTLRYCACPAVAVAARVRPPTRAAAA